jgi:hypothetical protein
MEHEPEPHVRRAYGALLGDHYERMFYEHIQLSAATQAFAENLEAEMEWQRASVEEAVRTMPLQSFQPTLITDQGSAFIDPSLFYRSDPPIGAKIAEFVAAIGATFAVVTYGSSGGSRKRESFIIIGTDGWTLREMHLLAAHKRLGTPRIELRKNKQGPPWESESGFLSQVARKLRERESE